MAARGTLMFMDDAITTPGQVRGWKIGFGYTSKGTVVLVYRVAADGNFETVSTEIPLAGNGRADTGAVTTWLAGQGVSLSNAVKQVIGA